MAKRPRLSSNMGAVPLARPAPPPVANVGATPAPSLVPADDRSHPALPDHEAGGRPDSFAAIASDAAVAASLASLTGLSQGLSLQFRLSSLMLGSAFRPR